MQQIHPSCVERKKGKKTTRFSGHQNTFTVSSLMCFQAAFPWAFLGTKLEIPLGKFLSEWAPLSQQAKPQHRIGFRGRSPNNHSDRIQDMRVGRELFKTVDQVVENPRSLKPSGRSSCTKRHLRSYGLLFFNDEKRRCTVRFPLKERNAACESFGCLLVWAWSSETIG